MFFDGSVKLSLCNRLSPGISSMLLRLTLETWRPQSLRHLSGTVLSVRFEKTHISTSLQTGLFLSSTCHAVTFISLFSFILCTQAHTHTHTVNVTDFSCIQFFCAHCVVTQHLCTEKVREAVAGESPCYLNPPRAFPPQKILLLVKLLHCYVTT